jgi:S1-C subfamily serine protease
VRPLLAAVAALVLVSTTGCNPAPEVATELQPVNAPKLQGPSGPIRFERLRARLREGAVVGGYTYSFGQCYPFEQKLYWGEGQLGGATDGWRRAAHRTLDRRGFTVTDDPGALFDDMAHDRRAAAYLLGGVIRDLRVRACEAIDLMTGDPAERQSGAAEIRIAWRLYATRNRAVVYRAETRGVGRVRRSRRNGIAAIAEAAFTDALRRLTAKRDFRETVRRPARNQQPRQQQSQPQSQQQSQPRDQSNQRTAERDPARRPPNLEQAPPLSDTPVREQAEALRRSVVVVRTGMGHGSGFFITPRLVLTNAHVVRGEPTVTLEPVGGGTRRARVLRKHVARDVALLRAAGRGGRPLPIRTEPVGPASTVFAIGAPMDRELAASITQGTVSATNRRNRNGMRMLQADVDINPGNSGGPLLDANGNVVGISTRMVGQEGSIGVNFFVPIVDALAKLGLRSGPPRAKRGQPVVR